MQYLYDADVALLLGGDGTVHRHLPEIIQRKLPFLVVPGGSGNDFASSIGIHSRRHALKAWEAFCTSQQNVALIDVGMLQQASYNNPQQTTDTYFCCSAYLGLDAATNALANRLPRFVRAHGGYILSLFPTLLRFGTQRVLIRDRDGNVLLSEDSMLTCFANTPRYGHGLRIAPRALLNDGQLDLCFVRRISKPTLLALFSLVYWGKHQRLPFVAMERGRYFQVQTKTSVDVFADGEYVAQTPVDISILPSALSVIVPPGSPLLTRKSEANSLL
ncbi:MAG TPA: diacylglycerol kinase family protein [Terriglobales bacterium]|nr:diacylglycerol kinase family protein [Terriglobales bacterium]